ncbi:MAG: DNA topoisomerase 4 subunit A [Firmicutes bacterium]|nr:DNA topoisomerase 4 subunit A [Bacillota bacterium]
MNNIEQIEETNDRVIVKTMEEVMHESMMPYSEYVILDRALPRVEDGLKPVQRRILYTMLELGITPEKPHRKCARIVGDCLGKFHPHGDSSVYQALVRMAQTFNMGAILVDGHGNFGSIDGDPAAAMRYTEARLTPLAMELMRDIDKETVKFSCNFDDTLTEPDMLPGRYPNLLVNGASGIAVGLATNIPPHNLVECIDGVIAYIDNSRISLKEMMKIIKGPDFPSGGFVIADDGLQQAYETGRGKIILKAKVHIETGENDKRLIIIDELPFQVNKASLLENIMKVREEKKGILNGISEITDESDRNGMRAVIKIKKDQDPRAILDKLFKHTNLSTTFGINMVAIADGKPQQMGLLDIIAYYTVYQRQIILNRTRFELDAAKERKHILEGLVIAVKNIDEVIAIIKKSSSTSEARDALRKRFELSERQAQAILDLRLARLTRMEVYKLENELKDVCALIVKLEAILASKKAQMELIKTELLQIKKAFKIERKSVLLKTHDDYIVPADDDEKPLEEYIAVVNAKEHLKKMFVKNFTMATKEFSATSTKNEIMRQILKFTNKERLYCFTNLGNCYKVDCELVPDGKWRDKGDTIQNLVPEALENETIIFMTNIEEAMPNGDLMFYTREGMVKRTPWSEYGVVKSSFQAMKLKEGDEIIGIEKLMPHHSLIFVTKFGMVLNAEMNDIPSQGRISGGVKGIALNDGDECILIEQVSDEGEICLVTDKAYGKRVLCADIDIMARYRKGVKIADFGKKEVGTHLAFASYVKNPYSIVLEFDDNSFLPVPTEVLKIENRTSSGKPILKKPQTVVRGYVYNTDL